MTRIPFRLPDIGEGIAETEIAAWHVDVGDKVEEDQPLVDVMTDKATVEITSPITGKVMVRYGEVGEKMKVGSVLLEFETETEAAAAKPEPKKELAPLAEPPLQKPIEATRAQTAAPLAAPATRRRAAELGIALELVPGTGPEGRITDKDLDNFIARGKNLAAPPKRTGVHATKIIGLRRATAERLQEAHRRIPHFSYIEECDLTEIEILRRAFNQKLKAGEPKITLLPFLMRALVGVLPGFPNINAHFDDEAGVLNTYDGIHIGIATQTSAGLLVPVVRHVETLDLWDCACELTRVVAAARNGSATREELTGSTITLSSLGALGGIAATPIINRPEVAIINPNKLNERPVVLNGAVVIRKMMNISSSFDHRIIDGFEAASFIQALKGRLEEPTVLFDAPP